MDSALSHTNIALILEICAFNSYACRVFKCVRQLLTCAILFRKQFRMSIDVSCPGCGKAYAVPDERAGQRFKCKECRTAVFVPADEREFESGDAAYGASTGGFQDPYNPYAEPMATGNSRQRIGRAEALSKTNICAIFLYIVAGISIPLHALNAVFTIVERDDAPGPGMRAPANEAEKTGKIVFAQQSGDQAAF
jgi:hypothetical protein